jgi:outer membrane lipopolysaccharide assembly protein LptE/RlpB
LYKRRNILPVLFMCLFISSCGYKFAGTGSLPKGIKSIYINMLENASSETGIENVITNDLIYEFTRINKNLVTNPGNADAELSGKISEVSTNTVSHVNSYTTQERRVRVNVKIRLSSKGGNVIWGPNDISGSETFDVQQGDKHRTDQNRKEAIKTLSKRLAEKIYNRMTENF